jgi:hypothetical protein
MWCSLAKIRNAENGRRMTKPFCRELKIEGEVVWKGKQREGKRIKQFVGRSSD